MNLDLATDPATEFGFLLHDVGKVAITDGILHKPGPLTPAERAVMEQHPVIGARIVEDIPFLAGDRGSGGPLPSRALGRRGLSRRAGRDRHIPLAARVFSVADVLDALTTTRPVSDGLTD